MSSRDCIFKCGTLLGEYDQNARKYHEVETGEIHTRERCEAAKARLEKKPVVIHSHDEARAYHEKMRRNENENKNDHGNELAQSQAAERKKETEAMPEVDPRPKAYLDHTLAGIPRIITVVADSPEEMDDLANSWLRNHHKVIKFKGGQRVTTEDQYEITLYYEQL
jgi:hypothetical protein